MDQTQQANQITTGKVAKYMLLPGIVPRLRRMAGLVGHFLHIFTITFGAAGLIPRNHPCLLTQNIGKYKFRDIVGLAASNVAFSKKNIPQICMFFAVILGFLMSILMIGLLVANISIGVTTAQAQYFSNPDVSPVQDDVAYNLLHQVFGTTGLGNIWTGAAGDAAASSNIMSSMVSQMLATYSQAMLIIAAIIVIYLLIITVAESAQTGQPFGQKFDTVWAPIRLAVAIGLLVPLGQGYNSAQLIVFQSAHWGSALASNVWNNGLQVYSGQNFLSAMEPDPGYAFARGMFLIKVCEAAWNKVSGDLGGLPDQNVVKYPAALAGPLSTNVDAKATLHEWGVGDDNDFCGSVSVANSSPDFELTFNRPSGVGLPPESVSVNVMAFAQQAQLVYQRYFESLNGFYGSIAVDLVDELLDNKQQTTAEVLAGVQVHGGIMAYQTSMGKTVGNGRYFQGGVWPGLISQMDEALNGLITAGSAEGWAGAGSFYLTLSRANAFLSAASDSKPLVMSLPRLLTDATASPYIGGEFYTGGFFGLLQDKKDISKEKSLEIGLEINTVLKRAEEWYISAARESPVVDYLDYEGRWKQDLKVASQSENMRDTATSGFLKDAMELIDKIYTAFGLPGLHPIGRLMNFGNSLINGSVAMYVLAAVAGQSTAGSSALGSLLNSMGSIMFLSGFTLTVGVVTLPFVYFTFAVVEWIASVFEALIGMPLWALSFLTVGGDGFFGEKASQGAWLIFEIFLRPTVIIITLIGTLLIFNAAIGYLNDVYINFVPDAFAGGAGTATGAGAFGTVMSLGPMGAGLQILGYIILYVVLVYSFATSIFKLIDELPNQFMRWAGVSANGFGGIASAGVASANPYFIAQQFDSASKGLTEKDAWKTNKTKNKETAEKTKADKDKHDQLLNALRDKK